jgi:hypothetical protein
MGIAILFVICLSGCGNQTVTMHASWAQYYTSFKDLKSHADFAVSGSITQIGAAVQPGDGSMVYSDVTLTVHKVLWNEHPQKSVPSIVHFHENGGTYNGKTYILDDDPMYQTGQQVVLFFTEYSSGQYRVTGGPTGRFLVENNQVKPVVPNGVQLSPNTSVDTFARSVNVAR